MTTFNATFLTLIPKVDNAHDPKDFKLISLCNVIYKIITNVLVLHLRPLLPLLISLEQTRYVEGWKIMDSIILVHEIIHSLKSTGTPSMLIKLNFSKAFDKLN